ncbi:MAG: hypothetical protein GY796_03505 [Chloroflexi bacterium]|nr:hypothetical protein [Chloroflexota bacterium]
MSKKQKKAQPKPKEVHSSPTAATAQTTGNLAPLLDMIPAMGMERALPQHATTRPLRQSQILQLQRLHGNAHVKKFVHFQQSKVIQRQADEKNKGAKKASDSVKRKIAAIALAESYAGQESDIAWIYYNRWQKQGDKGLKASVAYRDKSMWYKVWATALGETAFAKDKGSHGDPKKYKNLSEYVQKNSWFKKKAQPRADNTKAIVDEVFKDPKKNPYKGWMGQGNLHDINLDKGKWRQARQYLHLQQQKKVADIFIKELPAGKPKNYSFVFDENAIRIYFQKNPKMLPKKVKSYAP